MSVKRLKQKMAAALIVAMSATSVLPAYTSGCGHISESVTQIIIRLITQKFQKSS